MGLNYLTNSKNCGIDYFCKMKKMIIFLLVFSAIMISVTYYYQKSSTEKAKPLPVLNPVDLNEEMVDPELLRIGYGHRIGDFSFTNHEGKIITQKEIEGKVFVAEYFFTTCPTICPVMNQEMQRVDDKFKNEKRVRILSFTVDPEKDTPEELKTYAVSHKSSKNWHFLTGEKEKLYSLARKSFFVLKPAEAANQGDVGSDFIHTNNFVLVDRNKRIRGYYDGTNTKEVDKLLKDIDLLLEEKE